MALLTPFHLAIPVRNLSTSKHFYEDTLGCNPGRYTDEWADYSLFGHQLVLHEDKNHEGHKHFNEVDGKSVPIPHFGVVLEWDVFRTFSQKLKEKNIEFQLFGLFLSSLIFYAIGLLDDIYVLKPLKRLFRVFSIF